MLQKSQYCPIFKHNFSDALPRFALSVLIFYVGYGVITNIKGPISRSTISAKKF
jgi:hypothetical protein